MAASCVFSVIDTAYKFARQKYVSVINKQANWGQVINDNNAYVNVLFQFSTELR